MVNLSHDDRGQVASLSFARKRRIIIGVVAMALATVLTIGLFQAALWKSEPTFEGKSLSYWLGQLDSIDIGPNGRSESIGIPFETSQTNAVADLARFLKNIKKAHEALLTIGTNRLDILVDRLQTKDSPVTLQVRQLADRMGIGDYSNYLHAPDRRGQALMAFQYLGDRAMPVVPQLLELTNHRDTNIQLVAWSALERVAPEEFRKHPHPPIMEHAHRK